MARTAPLRIDFAVTPRFDVFYALFVLTGSAPSPLDSWKARANARLPRDFERVARRVAPLPIFWPLLADAIQGVAGEVSFDEMLTAIRGMRADDLTRNVLSGMLPYNATSPAKRAINTLTSDPKSYRDELCLVLERFWESVFRSDWNALESRLHAESFRMRDLREEVSTAELGRELNLPVTLDDHAREVRPRSGDAVAYDRIERCYIVPSAFNTRRLWAKYETPSSQKVTLYFPIARDLAVTNRLGAEISSTPETHANKDINAESVFRALGDTTRYAIASILARTPTTSAELARSLKVSKPTITHHVHALRSAGLITETPGRGSTKLSLSRATVAALSGAAVEQLFASTAGLTLGTTRKRRS
jgi:ArsR family transcriptional regulator